MSESVLATYYKDTEFLKWLVGHAFVSHNETNIAHYYAIYQSIKLCKEGRCYDCGGLYPTWASEADIISGKTKNIKCAKRMLAKQEHLIKEFNGQIPPLFKDVNIDKLDKITDVARTSIKQYIDLFPNNPLHGMYIHAQDHQTGKTSALWYIVKELIGHGKITKGFILHTTVIFIDELQADMMTEDHLLMRKARNCDILLLDDFGNEKATQWSTSHLKAIIEERIWHQRATILASNIPTIPWLWQTGAETEMLSKIKQTMQIVELVFQSTHQEVRTND